MIFWQLFLTFSKIGIFNFGGGYAILSLIHNEVVEKQGWLTASEFTDIVAISQSTPGPIGINCATYTGYTAVLHAGMPQWAAVCGAILASVSVLWLPFLLMLVLSKIIIKASQNNKQGSTSILSSSIYFLRPAVVGFVAAAAILLMNSENFGSVTDTPFKFVVSVILFLFAFVGTRLFKIHPILMTLLCGIAGLIIYW
ncbi:MAG: chromate transporter [Prevotellaceae bacterium]|nr:chromate transporter [Candidatus Colivivens equi]